MTVPIWIHADNGQQEYWYYKGNPRHEILRNHREPHWWALTKHGPSMTILQDHSGAYLSWGTAEDAKAYIEALIQGNISPVPAPARAHTTPAMTLRQYGYIAIRTASYDGHEWMDPDTLSGSLEVARSKAEHENRLCGPRWTRDNPVQRIARIALIETSEQEEM